jgi:biotin carboxylase
MAGCILDKTLWIVSGSSEAIPGIVKAKEMGLFVVVSDANSRAPGRSYADDFVTASTYDIEATVNAARLYHGTKRKIDGVISIAADVPLTVASVARALNLPGLSLESAFLASDKVAMKKRFQETGIPIPWFQEIVSVAQLKEVSCKKGIPIIVKPVDSRGARGVLRLTEKLDLDWAFDHARSFSSSGRVMIEEYLDGPQISTESVMIDGVGYTPGFSDRNYEYLERFAPYIIENGGHQPSSLSKHEQKQITECAEMAGLALGIHTGVAKGDMVMTSEGPKVIEMAARLSGGYFSTDQIPLATGVDLVGGAIKLALGETVEPCELVPVRQEGVAIRYFFPDPGRVVAVENMEKALKIQDVNKLEVFVSEGDMIEPVTNHTKRAGFVITQGKSRQEAIELAQKIIDLVKIITEPISS